jgi:uncharacterized protein YcgI (DUF1989 family)
MYNYDSRGERREREWGGRKHDMVIHACNPSYLGVKSRMIKSSRLACTKIMRPFLKDKI